MKLKFGRLVAATARSSARSTGMCSLYPGVCSRGLAFVSADALS